MAASAIDEENKQKKPAAQYLRAQAAIFSGANLMAIIEIPVHDAAQCRLGVAGPGGWRGLGLVPRACGSKVAMVIWSSPKYLAATACTSALLMLRSLAITRAPASSGRPCVQLEPSSRAWLNSESSL